MKKTILICLFCWVALASYAQPKRPTIMVVPSDVWCYQHGYVTENDEPNYKAAFQSDVNLLNVIARINILMADRGFPLKNMESEMKKIEQRRVESKTLKSSFTGASVAESQLDELRRRAKADIIMQLTWSVNTTGPKRSVTYTIQGIDAYTNEQIAGAQGTGNPSFAAEIPVLLEEAVSLHMDNFADQLQTYFEDLETNGRKISLGIQVFDNGSGINLETEYDGKELAEIIDEWLYGQTVNHVFNKSDGSENYADYEQVRIPLYKKNGMTQDADGFIRELRRYLAAPPYELPAKVLPRGLGYAVLVIGEK